ncbi:MAG: FAD-binding protein, partial [Candidatus Thermoplasmatota archaeon]|nr:FAD-binding protein [Candidatus Thermoplasmatota archaeon]
QIGQTGQSVRPPVYVAVAISGAPQHMAGMKDSARIIAINTDDNCTMVQSADAAIIGDYREVIPSLIEKVESGFTFGL